jgi:hypothetical protein
MDHFEIYPWHFKISVFELTMFNCIYEYDFLLSAQRMNYPRHQRDSSRCWLMHGWRLSCGKSTGKARTFYNTWGFPMSIEQRWMDRGEDLWSIEESWCQFDFSYYVYCSRVETFFYLISCKFVVVSYNLIKIRSSICSFVFILSLPRVARNEIKSKERWGC